MALDFKDTSQIAVPKRIVDTIVGQDEAVNIIKKAARQRRNVLLIGTAGTGKSLCGQALAELLPKSKLVDILCINNPADEDNPLIQTVPAGKGKPIVQSAKITSMSSYRNQQVFFFILAMISLAIPWYLRKEIGDIMAAASLIAGMMFVAAFSISLGLSMRMGKNKQIEPKLLVDNSETKKAPFQDATGAHAGALLGDIRHDPLQSFLSSNKIDINGKLINIGDFVDEQIGKNKDSIIKEGTYEAVELLINTYFTQGFLNKSQSVKALSVNRYKYTGKLIKIITESGKELILTPEHKVYTSLNKPVESGKLKAGQEVITNE